MRSDARETLDNPFSTAGIMEYIGVNPDLKPPEEQAELYQGFNERYLVEPARLVDEINLCGDILTDDNVENLRKFLDAGLAYTYETLEDTPSTEIAPDDMSLAPLVQVLKYSRNDNSIAVTGADGRVHRLALIHIARHYQVTAENWFGNHWEPAGPRQSTPRESVNLAYNLMFAGWLTLDPKTATVTQRLLDTKLQGRESDKFLIALFDISVEAGKAISDLNKVTQKDWRKNGKAKKQYRTMFNEQAPREITFYGRSLWDTQFREHMLNNHMDLLENDELNLTLSFLQHFGFLETLNGVSKQSILQALESSLNLETLHAMRTLQSFKQKTLWQLIGSHSPMAFGTPTSRAHLGTDLDPARIKSDRQYRYDMYGPVRQAYYDALGEICAGASLKQEGLPNTDEFRAVVYSNYLSHALFRNSMSEEPLEIWKRANEIQQKSENILRYGDNMISVQGDIFNVRRNPHLAEYWLDSITVWEASDKFPEMDGFAASFQLQGFPDPFIFVLDEENRLHFKLGDDFYASSNPSQLEDMLIHLILTHVEAIKVPDEDDVEGKAPKIPGERGRIREVNREKYGPHYSAIPTGANRVMFKWEDLEQEAERLRLHYPNFPPDITEAVKEKLKELKDEHGEEVKELYSDTHLDPLVLHFVLSKKFKYTTWRSKETRSMSADPPRRVMIKRGNNHAFLCEQAPIDVTYVPPHRE